MRKVEFSATRLVWRWSGLPEDRYERVKWSSLQRDCIKIAWAMREVELSLWNVTVWRWPSRRQIWRRWSILSRECMKNEGGEVLCHVTVWRMKEKEYSVKWLNEDGLAFQKTDMRNVELSATWLNDDGLAPKRQIWEMYSSLPRYCMKNRMAPIRQIWGLKSSKAEGRKFPIIWAKWLL